MTTRSSPVTLAGEAYRAIREEILKGELRPGTPLSRRRLARTLGLGTYEVGRLLKSLVDDGIEFLTYYPRDLESLTLPV